MWDGRLNQFREKCVDVFVEWNRTWSADPVNSLNWRSGELSHSVVAGTEVG